MKWMKKWNVDSFKYTSRRKPNLGMDYLESLNEMHADALTYFFVSMDTGHEVKNMHSCSTTYAFYLCFIYSLLTENGPIRAAPTEWAVRTWWLVVNKETTNWPATNTASKNLNI